MKKMREKEISVDGIAVLVWWKRIKNVNLTVKAVDGQVRISVPWNTSETRVRQMLAARRDWIEQQQHRFRKLPKPISLHGDNGEEHQFFGVSYPLHVQYGSGRHRVDFDDEKGIVLHVRNGTVRENRLQVIRDWYRAELSARIPALIKRWETRMNVQVDEWRIKKMKTRWGTCNISRRRIWLNLELARQPEICLEYIIVHEMVHLLESGHSPKFYDHLDRLLPGWREVDALLQPY